MVRGTTVPAERQGSPPLLGLGSEARLRDLADLVPDGLFTTDLDGTVTFWNRAAERLTGWKREEAVGRRCSILAGDVANGCSCGAGPLRCDLARTGRSSKRCAVRTRDGAVLVIVKNAVPLVDERGATVGALESFAAVGSAEALADDACAATSASGRFVGLLGRHPAMLELFRMVDLVARATLPVLLIGESGAGKDAVARAIHRLSARAGGPLVWVDCATLDEPALARELGVAQGGTLLLDRLGDLPASVQPALLRAVAERSEGPTRHGAEADVRFVSTALADLGPVVAQERLRPDLYFRLAAFPLRVPPLREHASDVVDLAQGVLARMPGQPRLSADAVRALEGHAWPGNVRELEQVVEFAALRATGGEVRREHLPPTLRIGMEVERASPDPRSERVDLEAALARAGGNRTRAARALGISRVTLWKRLRRVGLGGA